MFHWVSFADLDLNACNCASDRLRLTHYVVWVFGSKQRFWLIAPGHRNRLGSSKLAFANVADGIAYHPGVGRIRSRSGHRHANTFALGQPQFSTVDAVHCLADAKALQGISDEVAAARGNDGNVVITAERRQELGYTVEQVDGPIARHRLQTNDFVDERLLFAFMYTDARSEGVELQLFDEPEVIRFRLAARFERTPRLLRDGEQHVQAIDNDAVVIKADQHERLRVFSGAPRLLIVLKDGAVVGNGHAAHVEDATTVCFAQLNVASFPRELHCGHHMH